MLVQTSPSVGHGCTSQQLQVNVLEITKTSIFLYKAEWSRQQPRLLHSRMARNLGNPGLSDLQGGASGSLVLGQQGPVCHVGFPAHCRPWKSHGFGRVQSCKQQLLCKLLRGWAASFQALLCFSTLLNPRSFGEAAYFWEEHSEKLFTSQLCLDAKWTIPKDRKWSLGHICRRQGPNSCKRHVSIPPVIGVAGGRNRV